MTLKYPFPDPNRKTRKQPEDDRLMRQAQKENFAIYLLLGRSTYFFNDVLPPKYIQALNQLQKDCIQYIKNEQKERIRLRNIAEKKKKVRK